MPIENDLIKYTLHLADTSLIMGHRLSEWTGHGPMLEQDIAISNIALDWIGQSRNFYQYAASLHGHSVTEDSLAYLRDAGEYKNLLITELPNGDWANTILKEFFISTWQLYAYKALEKSSDKQLAAIAEKSLKEVIYHNRWSSEWVIRLGDGTQESNKRMNNALEILWPYTGEMFEPVNYERALFQNRVIVDVSLLKNECQKKINSVFEETTLLCPAENIWMHQGGKTGIHTEHLGFILAEMQFLQRAYPGCEW